MNTLAQTAIEKDPLAAHAATEALLSALARCPALARAEVEEILRLVPGRRAIFRARLDGRGIILRHLVHADERADAAAQWQEIGRVHDALGAGEMRVNAPLHFDADLGLMALEEAPGTPLLTHLWANPPEARGALMARAADWLHAYTGSSTDWRGIDRKRWVRMAARASARQPHPELAAIEARILQKMRQLGRKLHRQPWRIAITHGDFHPNNLLVDGTRLTGIDLGGTARLPIYKDIARFLVHCARRDMLPSGQRRFGVDAGAYEAFVQAFGMDAQERDGFLPFMIAFETLFRVEHADFPAARIRHTQAMSEALFADLREVARGG